MNIDIGSKIKALRLSKSMTQEQLAKALHVSAQAVSKWEIGSSLPDIQLLPALSVAYRHRAFLDGVLIASSERKRNGRVVVTRA